MENKKSIKDIADSLGMSRMTIYRYIEKRREDAHAWDAHDVKENPARRELFSVLCDARIL